MQDWTMTTQDAPAIVFSGYRWAVKRSAEPVGPGPNHFSADNVSVQGGRLRLAIVERRGVWTCAEVIAQGEFGYGRYEWTIRGDVSRLDDNAVLGMFTWSDHPDHANRELDIEFARWSASGPVGNFTVQSVPRTHRFELAPAASSVHTIEWTPGRVVFRTTTPEGSATWDCVEGVPPAGGAVAPRINLWLYRGRAPGVPQEVVVEGFRYVAAGSAALG